jgi:hypothetical protein
MQRLLSDRLALPQTDADTGHAAALDQVQGEPALGQAADSPNKSLEDARRRHSPAPNVAGTPCMF